VPFVSPCLASVEELQHSQGFPLPPEASNRCLLEAPEIEEAPEVPFCVGDAKKCNHLPGPGLTDSRPSKLRSLSLITLVTPCLQGLKKPAQPTCFTCQELGLIDQGLIVQKGSR